jgi:hypothetical protein
MGSFMLTRCVTCSVSRKNVEGREPDRAPVAGAGADSVCAHPPAEGVRSALDSETRLVSC